MGRGTIERRFNGGGAASEASAERGPSTRPLSVAVPSPSLRDREDSLSYSRLDVHGREMNLHRAIVPGRNWRSPRARARGTANFGNFRAGRISPRTGVNFVNFASVEIL